MKFITIFLASSINEFHVQRLELGNFIRTLNDHFVSEGVYFRFIICEDLSTAIAKERKQNEYNELIKDCDYFYIILGKDIGQYTREEFDIAHNSFKEKNSPKIYTYFFEYDSEEKITDDLKNFRTHIEKEIQHYHSSFSNIDAIKLQMAFELIIGNEMLVNFRLENGNITLNNEKLLDVSNCLPIYSQDKAIDNLSAEVKKLEKEYELLKTQSDSAPKDKDIIKKIKENKYARNRIYKELHKIEKAILDLSLNIFKRLNSGKLDEKEREALEAFKAGNYDEGIKKLRLFDEEWRDEINNAESTIDVMEEKIGRYLSTKVTLIKALKVCNSENQKEDDIFNCYEEIYSYCKKHKKHLHFAIDYGYYLKNHNRIEDAEKVSKYIEGYYNNEGIDSLARADNLFLLGVICNDLNKGNLAKKHLRHAIKMRKSHFEDGGFYARHRYAFASNVLARMYALEKKYDKASPLYEDAINVIRDLATKDDRYESSLAVFLNNYAALLECNADLDNAEKYYKESLDIRKNRLKTEEDLDEAYVAHSYRCYATFLGKHNRATDEEVKVYFNKAIEIFERLSTYESSHKRDLLLTKYFYADYIEKADPDNALVLHAEVLEKRQKIYDSDPRKATFICDLCHSCKSVGKLMINAGIEDEGKSYLEKAYKLIKPIYEKEPSRYDDLYNEICDYLNIRQ